MLQLNGAVSTAPRRPTATRPAYGRRREPSKHARGSRRPAHEHGKISNKTRRRARTPRRDGGRRADPARPGGKCYCRHRMPLWRHELGGTILLEILTDAAAGLAGYDLARLEAATRPFKFTYISLRVSPLRLFRSLRFSRKTPAKYRNRGCPKWTRTSSYKV